jgi:hypothetical protein
VLKIYFLEYRMSTIDPQAENRIPSKAPQRTRVFSKVHRIKSHLKNNVKLKWKKMDGIICTIAFVTHEAHGVANL